MLERLAAYLPQDRLRALAGGAPLPDRAVGSALLADISGFTPLTEALARSLGPRRGAEELTRQIDAVFDALIAEIERYGGSVVGFAGDAITCWFDDGDQGSPAALRAATCALALQGAMRAFASVALPDGGAASLALKVAIASGAARRLVVGDAAAQLIDALAGVTLDRMAAGEHHAQRGEVIVDSATLEGLGELAELAGWRADEEAGERFGVLAGLRGRAEPLPWPAPGGLTDEGLRPWLLPAIYEREHAGLGDFFTEFRPVAALFLRFGGIVFEREEAGPQLDALVRAVQRVVLRYGGTLMQLTIGDKGAYFYVAFGAPLAHEDDARRAVGASLEMRDGIAELGLVAPVQIGVSFGIVCAGAFGAPTRRTYSLLGDDVNLAARLMQLAEPGEIILSGQVQAAVAAEFAVTPRPPVLLKGKSEPVPVFELISARQRRALRLEAPTYALPMVGRQEELARILGLLGEALAGRGQAARVIAEAGLGKSRLLAEVIRIARRRGVACYGGAARSDGTATPYLAWGPIWQALFDVDSALPPAEQAPLLAARLRAWAPARAAALPLLGPLLEVAIPDNEFTAALEPRDRKNALHALLLECLAAAARDAQARSSGLLIVLEDSHWLDAASRELLAEVAAGLAGLRALLLLAGRPAADGEAQAELAGLPQSTTIALAELSPEEAELVVRAKVVHLFSADDEAVSPALVGRLVARAQGNPFYLEELINYLRDRGLDPRDDLDLDALDLPTSLYSLVLSRIDHLTARQQITLKIASVLGRRFGFGAMRALYPGPADAEALRGDLDALSGLDLTPLDTPEPELAYLFKHIVTQEAAYGSLSFAMRAALHEQVGDYLELHGGESTPGGVDLLAFHYGRSANLAKRRHYLRRAGEAAAARYANAAAVDYLGQALELAPADDQADRYVLLRAREQVLGLQGDREAQRRDLGELEAAAALLGDGAPQAEAAVRRANYAYLTGDYGGAIEAAARAAGLAAGARDARLAVRAQQEWTWALIGQGSFAEGRGRAEECLRLALAAGDQRGAARALQALGEIAGYQGDHAAERERYGRALELARAVGDRRLEGGLLNNMGVSAAEQGDYAEARALHEQNLAIVRAIGNRRGEGYALGNLGDVAARLGDAAAAQGYLGECLAIMRALGDRQGQAIALYNLSKVARHLDNPADAAGFGEQALATARAIGDQHSEAAAQLMLGDALLQLGRLAEAEAAFEAAVALRRGMGQAHLVAEALAGLARVELVRGDSAAALAHVEPVLEHLAGGGALDGAEQPLLVLLTCYRALAAAGDPRAPAALAGARAALAGQAARIGDPATRQLFLEQVPDHRAIMVG